MPTVKPIEGTLPDSTHSLSSHLDYAFLFNEGKGISVADSSGNGHTGTLLGINGRTPRWENTYLDFPGNHAQRVRINHSDTWIPSVGTGEFTFVVRVRPQGASTTTDYMSRNNGSATQLGDWRFARSLTGNFLILEDDVEGHLAIVVAEPPRKFQTVVARMLDTEGITVWNDGLSSVPNSDTPNLIAQPDGFDIGIGAAHGADDTAASLEAHIEFVYIYGRALTDAEIIELSTSPYQMYEPFVTTPVGSRGTKIHKAAPVGATKTQWEFTPQFNNDDPFTITSTNTGADSDSVLSSSIDFIEVWLPPDHVYLLRVRHLVGGNLTDFSLAVDVTMRGALNSFDKFFALSVNTVTKANGVIEDITTGGIVVDEDDNIDVID